MKSNVKKKLTALLWMLFGSAIVFTSVIVMNQYVDSPESEKEIKKSEFSVKKQKKKKKKKRRVRRKVRKKSKASKSPRAPLPSLSSQISGVSFGLPEFSMDDLGSVDESVLGDVKNVVMTEDAVDQAPRPAQRAPIDYPKRARAKGVTGYVLFNLLISSTGSVEKVKLLESAPAGVFDDVAMTSVKNWRFEPATYQGKSVKVWAKQKIRFDLN